MGREHDYETKKDFISVMPEDLEGRFYQVDANKVFEYMEKTFHLSKDWKKECWREVEKRPRDMTMVEAFFRFTTQNIDPALRRILRRNDSVVIAICRWMVKDRVKSAPIEGQQTYYYPDHFQSPKK